MRAAPVGEAGALAGFDGGVELAGQVAPRQIGILTEDKSALRHHLLRRGGGNGQTEDEGCESGAAAEGAHRKVLLKSVAPMLP